MSQAEPVSVLRKIGNFVSDINTARAFITDVTENNPFSKVKEWNSGELEERIDSLNSSVDMNQNINSSLESLTNKLSSLSSVVSKNSEDLSELEGRLQSVRSQYNPSRYKREATDSKVRSWVNAHYGSEIMAQISKFDNSSSEVKENVDMSTVTDLFDHLKSNGTKNRQNMQSMTKSFDKNNLNSISSKIKRLKSKSIVDLSDKMTALQNKMMKIREKIREVRNTASTIRVGMKMETPSFVSLPVTAAVEGSRYTTLSLMFKTTEPSGTLLHLQNPSSSEEFIINLISGKVQMSFDIGEGSVAIESEQSVNDGEWHALRASRNGQLGHFSIDDAQGNTFTYTGASPGSVDILELDNNSNFLIGAKFQNGEIVDKFKGSLTNLQLNNEYVGLWGYKASNGSISPTQVFTLYKGFATAPKNGICLNGNGYTKFSGNGLELSNKKSLSINLKVQTFSSDGVLIELRNFNKSENEIHTISVELRSGSAHLLLNGKTVTSLKQKLSSGLPVEIAAVIPGNGTGFILEIRDRYGKKTKSTASSNSDISWENDDIKTISIGGNDEGNYISGTIKNIELDLIKMSVSQKDALVYTGAGSICLPPKSLDGVTFFGHGYLQYPGVSFTSNFSFRVRIRTKRPFGVVMYGTDSLGFNVISLSIDRGQVEFVAQTNFLKTVVRAGEGVNDGDWKDIHVTRDNSVVRLMIDGLVPNNHILLYDIIICGLNLNHK